MLMLQVLAGVPLVAAEVAVGATLLSQALHCKQQQQQGLSQHAGAEVTLNVVCCFDSWSVSCSASGCDISLEAMLMLQVLAGVLLVVVGVAVGATLLLQALHSKQQQQQQGVSLHAVTIATCIRLLTAVSCSVMGCDLSLCGDIGCWCRQGCCCWWW
jgi:hypothetical protein